MTKKIITTRDLCTIGVFAAIITVVGLISIPIQPVPMTLQTFIIPFAGVVLGKKKGSLAALIYVLIGMLGLPVFSGFKGGVGVLFGPTGGFILSFPIMAWLAGFGAERGKSGLQNVTYTTVGTVSGTLTNYLCGVVMFSIVMPSSIKTAFLACVLPFILLDTIKVVMAVALGLSVKKILVKSKILR